MDGLEAKTDHDLLILAVQELGHVKAHMTELTETVKEEGKKRNGRLDALEHWQTRMIVVLGGWSVAWPFLIQEFRQYVLEKFGFI